MASQTLEIKHSSASMWGTTTGIRTLPTVSKYIDTSYIQQSVALGLDKVP